MILVATGENPSPRGFYQQTIENKYIVDPKGHPLEEAHTAAELIMEKFNELVTKHN